MTLSSACLGEQIRLVNGDILNGKLLEKSATHLIWMSDNFGRLTIQLSQIINLDETFDSGDVLPPTVSNHTTVPRYSGGLSMTGSAANGNQSRRDWDVDMTIQRRTVKARQTVQFEYENHSLEERQAEVSHSLGYANDWFYSDKWFVRNKASVGADETRAIAKTYTVGSAIGHQFWDTPNSRLSLESGVLWIVEEVAGKNSSDHLTWSWSLDYSHVWFKRIELFHSQDIRVSMQHAKDSQADIDLGIKVPLIKNLFTELKLELLYDNQPALDTERLDSQFSMGINYSW
jgi:hypothetical protein